MFDSQENIYQFVGTTLLQSLPDQWVVSWIDTSINIYTKRSAINPLYLEDSESNIGVRIDIDKLELVKMFKAFDELFKIMQRDDKDIPWNKSRFVVHHDGDFEVDFKYDPDLDWLNALDPDNDIYPEHDIIQAINSWDGLSEHAYRPWLDPETPMYKGGGGNK